MPKQLYSADKVLEWLRDRGYHTIAEMVQREGEYGTFDPTPPVQSDTNAKEYGRLFDLMDGKGEVIKDGD